MGVVQVISCYRARAEEKKTNQDALRFVTSGYEGAESHPDIALYAWWKNEITLFHGIVLWAMGYQSDFPTQAEGTNSRALAREPLRNHIGMMKMKGLARAYTWWPLMDQEIEGHWTVVEDWEGCQMVAKNRAHSQLHRWDCPAFPWQTYSSRFCEPVKEKILIVVVYAHSKWPEIIAMSNTNVLHSLFSRMELPVLRDQAISDNGPQFTSAQFKYFLNKNSVRHVTK